MLFQDQDLQRVYQRSLSPRVFFQSGIADLPYGLWAGVDTAWEQKKLEATLREMLENMARREAAVPSALHAVLLGTFLKIKNYLIKSRHS